jgi:pectate lyase
MRSVRYVMMVVVLSGLVQLSNLQGVATAASGGFVVDPKAPAASDENPGTADKPLKTLAKALELAKAGDTIVLRTGDYPAVEISKTYEKPLTIRAAKGARPVMTGGLAIRNGGGLRISGLTFTWPAGGRPDMPFTGFIAIGDSKDIEIAECEIFDDPKLSNWSGGACYITRSEHVTVRDSKAHHFYFGISVTESKHVILRNLEIGPWTHEDGIRVTACEGPILIEGCHISNAGVGGRKRSGHLDGIQGVYWSENVTIRNCHIHDIGQGIGAFLIHKGKKPRRNWRIEGNLIYDISAPHACSIYDCDGVTLINNTFPQDQPLLHKNTTGIVAKNNIFRYGTKDAKKLMGAGAAVEYDYNLWIGGTKVGEHDLAGVDPKFVNAPLFELKSDHQRLKEMTRSKLCFHIRTSLKGKIAVGDTVEVMNTDGSGRDAKPRKVTAVGDNWLEFDPPLATDPGWGAMVFKWPAGHKNLVPDYRLRADSPAIDSADSSVKRGRDRAGHKATDAPGVANTGAGDVKYLDRGALEFVPGK